MAKAQSGSNLEGFARKKREPAAPNGATDGGELVQLNAKVQKAGRKELVKLAADEEREVRDLVTEAVNDLLRKYGRPPVA